MPETVNPYIDNFNNLEEQSLLQSLIEESIRFYGIEVVYLPREYRAKDNFYGDDVLSNFTKAYKIEAYIKNINFYEGEGVFASKFGYEIRDEISLNMTIARFDTLVRTPHQEDVGTDIFRPREGDLIYFPLDKRLFEISMNEKRSVYFQLGSLYMYTLKCREFELTGENFTTGLNDIDDIEDEYDFQIEVEMSSGFGSYIIGEDVTFNAFRAKVVSWDATDKILTIMNPNMETVPNDATLTGELSGASFMVADNVHDKNVQETVIDNDEPTVGIVVNQPNPFV